MHKRLLEEGFNRRYVLLPMLLAIVLVVLGFWVTHSRHAEARALAEVLRERQDVMQVLTETGYESLEAESAQRGFLLTGESQYLTPLASSLARARELLRGLQTRFAALQPDELPVLRQLAANLDVKADEMNRSVNLLEQGAPREALALVKSDLGLHQMTAISESLQALHDRERERFDLGMLEWADATRINSLIDTGEMIFTVSLLLILGLLATRDIRRREVFATELAAQIDARTAELADLSQHMSRVAENEKRALARELHDELGGLLVTIRMDLMQLRKKLAPNTDADMATRWERVEQGLAQGLELKRRVIEDLRPTLLDNMGLFTALRWLATQRAEQAQLALQLDGLDEDIEVGSETAIAIFRTAQEAIANIISHAGATRFSLEAEADEGEVKLTIADDGQGIPANAERRNGSHGLRQMRFRIEGVGGTLSVSARQPRGTVIVLTVPRSASDAALA